MIKYKKWIGNISRTKEISDFRYKKIRLDKNERVSNFKKIFFRKFISTITSKKINTYPEVSKLYKALSKYHKINRNQFVLTAGADSAIKNCFELCVSKDDRIIALNPTYAMVDIYSKIFGAKKINITYNKNLNININFFLRSINRKISLIVIANPNSPTGTLISKTNIEKIIKKANKFGIAVLVDEAYYGFSNQTVVPMIKKYNNLIVSRTFSKAYGMAGLRIGYIISNSKIARLLFNLKPLYEINSVGVEASVLSLKNTKFYKKYISETKQGLKIIIKYLKENNIKFITTNANFIYINLGKKINYYYKKLLKAGILSKKGLAVKGYNNYLRITLGPSQEMKIFISKFKKIRSL